MRQEFNDHQFSMAEELWINQPFLAQPETHRCWGEQTALVKTGRLIVELNNRTLCLKRIEIDCCRTSRPTPVSAMLAQGADALT
jgi:hypothetical protein